MIVEMREYVLQIGAVGEYFQSYESRGLDIQVSILGNLVGYYSTEVGDVNQVVHMWAYESMEDRSIRRTTLFSNPDWLEYIKGSGHLIKSQKNRILTPHFTSRWTRI